MAKVEFYGEVRKERNPLLEGFGKISSSNLKEFIDKRVLIKVIEIGDAPD